MCFICVIGCSRYTIAWETTSWFILLAHSLKVSALFQNANTLIVLLVCDFVFTIAMYKKKFVDDTPTNANMPNTMPRRRSNSVSSRPTKITQDARDDDQCQFDEHSMESERIITVADTHANPFDLHRIPSEDFHRSTTLHAENASKYDHRPSVTSLLPIPALRPSQDISFDRLQIPRSGAFRRHDTQLSVNSWQRTDSGVSRRGSRAMNADEQHPMTTPPSNVTDVHVSEKPFELPTDFDRGYGELDSKNWYIYSPTPSVASLPVRSRQPRRDTSFNSLQISAPDVSRSRRHSRESSSNTLVMPGPNVSRRGRGELSSRSLQVPSRQLSDCSRSVSPNPSHASLRLPNISESLTEISSKAALPFHGTHANVFASHAHAPVKDIRSLLTGASPVHNYEIIQTVKIRGRRSTKPSLTRHPASRRKLPKLPTCPRRKSNSSNRQPHILSILKTPEANSPSMHMSNYSVGMSDIQETQAPATCIAIDAGPKQRSPRSHLHECLESNFPSAEVTKPVAKPMLLCNELSSSETNQAADILKRVRPQPNVIRQAPAGMANLNTPTRDQISSSRKATQGMANRCSRPQSCRHRCPRAARGHLVAIPDTHVYAGQASSDEGMHTNDFDTDRLVTRGRHAHKRLRHRHADRGAQRKSRSSIQLIEFASAKSLTIR